MLTEKVGPFMFVDEVNSIRGEFWNDLRSSSFRFYYRPASTAGDIEIYRAQDYNTVVLMEFNAGDGCASYLFDGVDPVKFHKANNIIIDNKWYDAIYTDGRFHFDIRGQCGKVIPVNSYNWYYH